MSYKELKLATQNSLQSWVISTFHEYVVFIYSCHTHTQVLINVPYDAAKTNIEISKLMLELY